MRTVAAARGRLPLRTVLHTTTPPSVWRRSVCAAWAPRVTPELFSCPLPSDVLSRAAWPVPAVLSSSARSALNTVHHNNKQEGAGGREQKHVLVCAPAPGTRHPASLSESGAPSHSSRIGDPTGSRIVLFPLPFCLQSPVVLTAVVLPCVPYFSPPTATAWSPEAPLVHPRLLCPSAPPTGCPPHPPSRSLGSPCHGTSKHAKDFQASPHVSSSACREGTLRAVGA